MEIYIRKTLLLQRSLLVEYKTIKIIQMKRYLNLKPRPKAKNASRSQGSPSSRSNREKKENEDTKKLNEWNNL